MFNTLAPAGLLVLGPEPSLGQTISTLVFSLVFRIRNIMIRIRGSGSLLISGFKIPGYFFCLLRYLSYEHLHQASSSQIQVTVLRTHKTAGKIKVCVSCYGRIRIRILIFKDRDPNTGGLKTYGSGSGSGTLRYVLSIRLR
jgi:hypothetical protein